MHDFTMDFIYATQPHNAELAFKHYEELIAHLSVHVQIDPNNQANTYFQLKKVFEEQTTQDIIRALNTDKHHVQRKTTPLENLLLFGSVAQDLGMEPSFHLTTSPQDEIYEQEQTFLQELENQDHVNLATSPSTTFRFRSEPLEEVVLFTDKHLIKADLQFIPSDSAYETVSGLYFKEAVAQYHAEMIKEHLRNKDFTRTKIRLERGLQNDPENNALLHLQGFVAGQYFDDVTHTKAIEKLVRNQRSDSLNLKRLYDLTKDQGLLSQALSNYPSYARAIAEKASILSETKPEEAKKMFGIASTLLASTSAEALSHFYVQHAIPLSKLYGKKRVTDILTSKPIALQDKDEFQYHLRLYQLQGAIPELHETAGNIVTPKDRSDIAAAATYRNDSLQLPEVKNHSEIQDTSSTKYTAPTATSRKGIKLN